MLPSRSYQHSIFKMAADPRENAGRIVFIGNIPYNLAEEQILSIFSSVGQIQSFRMVFDSENGRPKGFGFLEFADTDAAASAVRNLNNYEIMGRELRVDFSHVGGKEDTVPANYNAQPPQPPQASSQSNGLPPLPPGAEIPPTLTCTSAISKTLQSLPPPQLLDILSQMKGLVLGDPQKATELLKQAPQLSYAIFQALLLMGLVDTTVLASVVEQAAQPVHPPPAQQIPPRPPVQNFQPLPQPAYQQYSTPPVANPPYQPPPVQAPPPPGQEELLKQVLAMSQHQIDQLQPIERSQIMALRQQLMGRY